MTEQLGVEMALHYEFNGWTTGFRAMNARDNMKMLSRGTLRSLSGERHSSRRRPGFRGYIEKKVLKKGLKNLNTWLGAKLAF